MQNDDHSFTDYYKILEVRPNCSARALETAYHSLAKKYHPDHAEEADVGKLTDVINAYKVLKDQDRRLEYDVQYARVTGYVFTEDQDLEEERAAISDADAHAKILQFLYNRRREHARDAGVGHFSLQELIGCTDEHFEFHIWYLREKGFIVSTDQGALAITIAGVDHVISMSRAVVKEKLLLGQSDPHDRTANPSH